MRCRLWGLYVLLQVVRVGLKDVLLAGLLGLVLEVVTLLGIAVAHCLLGQHALVVGGAGNLVDLFEAKLIAHYLRVFVGASVGFL